MLSGQSGRRKRIQASDFGRPSPVRQKAERVGEDQRIVNALTFDVGLAEDDDRRAAFAVGTAPPWLPA